MTPITKQFVADMLAKAEKADTAIEQAISYVGRDIEIEQNFTDEATRLLRDFRASLGTKTLIAILRALQEKDDALKPFVDRFETCREQYANRHFQNKELGYSNFDKMPDHWPTDEKGFDMGTLRRARAARTKE